MLNRRHILAGLGASALTTTMTAQGAWAMEYYKMATLSPGSSPYLIMSTFAKVVGDAMDDVQIQVNATGAATAHAVQSAQGKLDFFMMAPIVHQYMTEGSAMFDKLPQAPELAKSLRSVLIFPIGYYHIVTFADSGIASMEDFRGKTVFLGPPTGSATVTMQRMIEGATGMKPDEDYTPAIMSSEAALQAFQDGRIDVFSSITLPPSPVIEQLALSRDIRLIGLTEDELAKPGVRALVDRPGGATAVIPAGTYGKRHINEADTVAIASFGGIATNDRLPEDVIYQMTKAFWEGIEPLREGAPWLRNVTLETVFAELNIPLHPGAARYYEEIGLTIPEIAKPVD